MTYAMLDDQTARKAAIRSAGLHGRGLWYTAVVECAAVDGDGLMTALMVRDAAYLAEVHQRKAVTALVEQGLWHDHETVTTCGACMDHGGDRAQPGDFVIHEWWEMLLTSEGKKDPLKREHELRRKRLYRNSKLVAAIRRRDLDLCRYCGVHTAWGADHKSPRSGTLDHVDPIAGQNRLTDVVVACRRCNGRKKDRTPDQAHMTLLPEPDPTRISNPRTGSGADRVDTDPAGTGIPASISGTVGTEPGPKSSAASRDAQDGTGLDRCRPGVDTGLDRIGSGPPDQVPTAPSNGRQPEGDT